MQVFHFFAVTKAGKDAGIGLPARSRAPSTIIWLGTAHQHRDQHRCPAFFAQAAVPRIWCGVPFRKSCFLFMAFLSIIQSVSVAPGCLPFEVLLKPGTLRITRGCLGTSRAYWLQRFFWQPPSISDFHMLFWALPGLELSRVHRPAALTVNV